MKFTKMHGCGNDYVYVNCFEENVPNPAKLSTIISDRHKGIGADGLILILPTPNADAFMQLYNSDGSSDTMCGNGIRCVAKYVYDHGLVPKDRRTLKIDTPVGMHELELTVENGKVSSVCVDMGIGRATTKIPEDICVHGMNLKYVGINVGNDHAVYFLDENPELAGIHTWPDSKFAAEGDYFERHKNFPNRVNSEFIEVLSRKEINMRVYERGSGETMACGTGSTASAFAGVASGRLDRNCGITVHLRGGDLVIRVDDENRCFMTGPAVEVFNGEYDLAGAD
ncbi:MAG: diaminopimelate epimerase [Synergistaceae bacterium]|nr:diaminopimelate epimerase [Synergistaceae bacterium]